jgi:2-haloacid dehalogenase
VTFRPKYITFDCYGTLTYFPMHQMAYDLYEGQLPPEQMRLFVKDFADYRFDEVMGDWKPYLEILQSALARTCKRHGLTYRDEDARKVYDAAPPGARMPTCRMPSTAWPGRSRW